MYTNVFSVLSCVYLYFPERIRVAQSVKHSSSEVWKTSTLIKAIARSGDVEEFVEETV